MRRIIGAVFVSLDGVMQAPGGPTEDPTGGFEYGGWMAPCFDEEGGAWLDAFFAGPFDLLLGRRTYDIFAAFWPYAEGDQDSIGRKFDRAAKYVLTRSDAPLEWENSHCVHDVDAIAGLKRGDGPDLIIQGSSTLYPQLLGAGLIDRLTILTFPVILGSGKRLFGVGTAPGAMRMTEHRVTEGGTVIATYEPAGAVETGDFGDQEPSAAEQERQRRMAEGSW